MTADTADRADTAVLPLPAASAPAPVATAAPRGWWRQLGIDTGYVLVGFPLAIASFVLIVTGTALGLGLTVIWVGLPVAIATLIAARGFAAAERVRLPAVLRTPVTSPRYLRAAPGDGRLRRLFTPMRDAQYWLDALHGVLHLVPAIPAFVIVVTWWSVALAGLTSLLWDWSIPYGPPDRNLTLPELLGFVDSAPARIAVHALVGALFAVTLPIAVRGSALLVAQPARLLLCSRAATQAELGRLADSRDSAVAAEAVALRRLERDIHDGPQQRLVRLSMDLHRARRQVETDPEGARETLAEAATQTRETLEELRALSRGIAPPVLADRGLAAALAALAARSPVPVELSVGLDAGERLAPATENTAYFVVSEALANVAKHSGAALCRVAVDRSGDRLTVTVEDDGAGGAVAAPGHGITGLADRLRAVDGTLTVDSPRGGPTRLTAVLPWA
ncbi:sensor histidine kinase [Modestobacter lapidis]|nr:sensor histidine kinase [Modestobacter lapidis]